MTPRCADFHGVWLRSELTHRGDRQKFTGRSLLKKNYFKSEYFYSGSRFFIFIFGIHRKPKPSWRQLYILAFYEENIVFIVTELVKYAYVITCKLEEKNKVFFFTFYC